MLSKSSLLFKLINYSFVEIKYLLKISLLQSFSQHGEDRIIDKIFKKKKFGKFVDVGCHSPIRFSNTFFFYKKRNWTGICIDPEDKYKKLYRFFRPKDKFINCGIGLKKKKLVFYKFNPTTLSTFSEKIAQRYIKIGYRLLDKKKIYIYPLKELIKSNFDLLSVDTEGYEIEVLKSINWKKAKPKIIIIETNLHMSDEKKQRIKITNYLKGKKYKLTYDNKVNSIFILKK